jgi:hypothetical protein
MGREDRTHCPHYKRRRSETVTQLRSKDGDEELTALFQEWLIAFEKTQSASGDGEPVAALALSVGASTIGAGGCAHGAARVASGNFAVAAMPVPVGMGHGEEPP